MLWLALRLPLLPLEVFPLRPPSSAVIARDRIVACDSVAAKGGVFPGMRLSDAWALLPELTVLERDPAREARQLEALACWAGGFTSDVSLSLPDALLLEVQGSLRLFGGLDALLDRVMAGIAAQGHDACAALAPTPQAALWLAGNEPGNEAGRPAGRDGKNGALAPAAIPRCLGLSEMREALAALPLSALELPVEIERRVSGFGVRCLGDLLRLPRAGLARRLGAEFTTRLAQGLGELPDPRLRFGFPESFRQQLELPARVEDAARLLFAAQRLVMMLCGWLAARASGVSSCQLLLEHDAKASSTIELNFSGATRDPERIGRVLRERLERLQLSSSVLGLVLQAEAPEPMPGREAGLFGETAAGEGVLLLVERLQARLGVDGVHGLAALPEHRPEQASRAVAPERASTVPSAQPAPSVAVRPSWLLPAPQPLAEIGGRPQRGGPLTLLAGPERIESGWWDAGEAGAVGDVRRDYFVAVSQHKEWLWIYRSEDGWFLHGIYA